jgi:hypothetical protein
MKRYQHHKGEVYIQLVGHATHSETGETLVLYANAKESNVMLENVQYYVRPYDMFHGHLEDGTKRFTELS